MKKNINTLVKQEKKEFDRYYKKLLQSILAKDELSKAIMYASTNGGKRIRPFITSVFAKIAKVKKHNYLRLASVIESIHTYSLIHDDLPSMDNDDYRRGKPTVHKKFNEAIAILAGDALHDLAFEVLADSKTDYNSNIRIKLIQKLSKVLGGKGLAGGQTLDILYEKKKVNKKQIINMYLMKTSSLFEFCCCSSFILAKKNKDEIKFAENYGKLYGLIFQIVDDIIDSTENFVTLGKTPGKDIKQDKKTLVLLSNKKIVINFCHNEIIEFINKNKKYFKRWKILENILLSNIEKYL